MLLALGEVDEERDAGRGLWEKGCRKGTVEKGMLDGDCGKRAARRVGKGLPEWDCGKRAAGMGLWEKGCRKGTVGKGMLDGDCGKRDA